MTNIWILIVLASLMLLVVGFFRPDISLFWYRKQRTKKISLIFYFTTLFISFLLFGFSIENQSNDSQVVDTKEPELTQKQKDSVNLVIKNQEEEKQRQNTLSASALVSAYTKNEISADNTFKGKEFYVVGYVEHIGKDIMDNSYVTLKSNDLIRNVQCYVDDKDILAQLQTGQKITLYGECDGLMMNVLMKDCKIVENLKSK